MTHSSHPDAAYQTLSADQYQATDLTRGPWHPEHQHAGPPIALVCRAVEHATQAAGLGHIARITANLLRPESDRDAIGTAQAHDGLSSAYAWIDRHLAGRTWVAGDAFSMADCAAAPALFYAVTYVPIAPQLIHLTAYFDRLMDRPSVARTIDAARPFFQYYPGRSGLSRRFFEPEGS